MKTNRRGMVLVTVMFFILIVGLFGRAMLINGPAMAQLASNLADGAWAARHQDLLQRDELDVGYRLVVATGSGGPT